jgi:probable HAF family extracellular repeat protein
MKSTAAILLGLVLCPGLLCQPVSGPPAGEVPSGATFQGLGDLPGGDTFSVANAVSGNGNVVVGWSDSGEGMAAFRWENGVMSDLAPGAIHKTTVATAVSRDGSIIVGYRNLPDVGTVTVRWTADAGFQDLNDPSDVFDQGTTTAAGVSADGSVVCGGGLVRQGDSLFTRVAARFDANGSGFALSGLPQDRFSSANGISADGSVIVGEVLSDSGSLAFRWTTETGLADLGNLAEVNSRVDSRAFAASADGSVIVGASMSAGGMEAFRWTQADGMVGLGKLSAEDASSSATSVSAHGEAIVGRFTGTVRGTCVNGGLCPNFVELVQTAFIWDEAHGMRDLRDVLVSDFGLDLPGWTLTNATGISEDGLTIVGTGINPSGDTEAWIVHLPAVAQ